MGLMGIGSINIIMICGIWHIDLTEICSISLLGPRHMYLQELTHTEGAQGTIPGHNIASRAATSSIWHHAKTYYMQGKQMQNNTTLCIILSSPENHLRRHPLPIYRTYYTLWLSHLIMVITVYNTPAGFNLGCRLLLISGLKMGNWSRDLATGTTH